MSHYVTSDTCLLHIKSTLQSIPVSKVSTCLFGEAELFFFSADGETGDTETDSVQENFDDVNQALIIQNLISVVMSDLYPYASSMRCLWAP